MKETIIELMEYNVAMSLIDFLKVSLTPYKVHNKNIDIYSSYADIKIPYKVPAIAAEILYRKNRSIGFGNFYGDVEIIENNKTLIMEIEGTLYEYRIQLNVYSNTRGENYKWCSILDDVLKNGEKGISINTYDDKGIVKTSAVGNMDYDYSQDVKSNGMNPNIESYDFHTIYEVKSTALQKFVEKYDIMEIGNIIGKLK